MLHDHQGQIAQSTVSANLGLPVNLLSWFRSFWLRNLVQISQLKTLTNVPEIC